MKDGLGEMRRRACERGGSLLLWAAPAPCIFLVLFFGCSVRIRASDLYEATSSRSASDRVCHLQSINLLSVICTSESCDLYFVMIYMNQVISQNNSTSHGG